MFYFVVVLIEVFHHLSEVYLELPLNIFSQIRLR
jgi:hypothetical protein